MKDYLCIGKVLDLKKYDSTSRLTDFSNREFYIISAESVKGNDKEGFYMTIEDENGLRHKIKTFSSAIVKELRDLLLSVKNLNGVFETAIKCSLQVTPIKIDGKYKEKYKLI